MNRIDFQKTVILTLAYFASVSAIESEKISGTINNGKTKENLKQEQICTTGKKSLVSKDSTKNNKMLTLRPGENIQDSTISIHNKNTSKDFPKNVDPDISVGDAVNFMDPDITILKADNSKDPNITIDGTESIPFGYKDSLETKRQILKPMNKKHPEKK